MEKTRAFVAATMTQRGITEERRPGGNETLWYKAQSAPIHIVINAVLATKFHKFPEIYPLQYRIKRL